MKKIEYPEYLLKTVDTFSELRAIRSLIGKYMMIKKLMYDVKRDENVTSRLPDDLITGVRDRIAELIERRDFLDSKEDDIRLRLVESLKDLLVSKILHMERFDNVWKLDEYVGRHFDNVDCHASDRVIDYLIEDNLPEKYRAELDGHRKTISHWKEIRLKRA